jgi:redox-sensitive bicupin YhaK (pirin superfamily)
MTAKRILGRYTNERGHWVGNGFPVRSLFDYNTFGRQLSPFLLLDRAGPHEFAPGDDRRGVGTHPHRGFETVTIVYAGEVSHRDSGGGGGTIGPGDVQWMTAGSGVVHEEFHAEPFTRRGGLLDMVQLWVNLPAKHKMTTPRYQSILDADMPRVALPDGAGTLRVIAGDYAGVQGPAHTFSPMLVADVQLVAGKRAGFTVLDGWSLAVVLLHGRATASDQALLQPAQFALYDQAGSRFSLHAEEDSLVLLLAGAPLNEPIEGYGPFVMNTAREIDEAIDDFNSGRFGTLPVAG